MALSNAEDEYQFKTQTNKYMDDLNVLLNNYVPYKLRSTTFDIFARKYNVNATAIKIDVDGAEMNVLRGMELTLKSVSVKTMLIEVEHSTKFEVREFMENLGYKFRLEEVLNPHTINYIFDKAGSI